MGIGFGRWVVRYRNRASRPMKLSAAKRYAIEMIRASDPGRIVTDPIGDLNRMQAVLADFAAIRADQDHDDGPDRNGHSARHTGMGTVMKQVRIKEKKWTRKGVEKTKWQVLYPDSKTGEEESAGVFG